MMTRRLPGKKIDTWEFKIHGERIYIDVRLEKIGRHSNETEFTVVDERFGLRMSDKDINKLRREVLALVTERLKVEWATYYLVEFSGSAPPEPGDDAGMEDDRDFNCSITTNLKIECYELGTRPDGTKCYRTQGSSRVYDGEPDTGEAEQMWRETTMRCLVPATAENKEALDTIVKAFHLLSGKLHKFFDPQVVQKNLLQASGLVLLEGPKGKSGKTRIG